MKEINEVLSLLFSSGPTPSAMNKAKKLALLRQEYAAWLTKDISIKLEPFERHINEIGQDAWLLRAMDGNFDDPEERQELVSRMFDKFKDVLGITDNGHTNAPYAIEALKEEISVVLGIEELIQIRRYLIQ